MIESPMITFPLLILFLPLISFIILIFFGKKLPRQGDWVAVGSIVTTFILAVYLFVQMLTNYDANFSHGASLSWIDIGAFKIDLGILVDNLTIVMLLIVTLVSSCTHIFSLEYMKGDVRYNRYYAYLGLFTFSMNGIVLADNLISMYMSWELVGVSSYLLIGHWFEKDSAANASKKAFLTNRVGDIGFFIGIMLLYSAVGAFTFVPIFDSISGGEAIAGMTLTLAGLGIFMGAVGKSSQFPLHIWLPDAMEGPTPVSALMHAATMVKAGLYLVARMFPFFGAEALHNDLVDLAFIIALIGGITAVMAAAIAFVQHDLKKVLAYSTMSQLAYIFTGLGCAMFLANTLDWHNDDGAHYIVIVAFGAALFHLFNHAMAKGMLFMASGSVIHEVHHAHHHLHHHDHHDDEHHGHDDHHEDEFDAQSMENMGGLASKMPLTATAMLVGSASIMGLPFIGGFWSKEGIIANAWRVALEDPRFFIPAICVLVGAGMTGFYMSRMWLKTFAGKPKTEVAAHVGPTNTWIKIPLFVLTFVSLSAVLFAGMGFTHWAPDSEYGLMSEKSLIDGIVYEMNHAFANSDAFFFILTYIAIAIGAVLGPGIALSLYGGKLAEGEKVKPWMKPIIRLNSWVFDRFHFDNKSLANSGLSKALANRLYFDHYYDLAMLKLVAGFSDKSAETDKNVVDGVIKKIESGSQSISKVVRSMTTGSARDYILMVSVGALAIFFLLWGVA